MTTDVDGSGGKPCYADSVQDTIRRILHFATGPCAMKADLRLRLIAKECQAELLKPSINNAAGMEWNNAWREIANALKYAGVPDCDKMAANVMENLAEVNLKIVHSA